MEAEAPLQHIRLPPAVDLGAKTLCCTERSSRDSARSGETQTEIWENPGQLQGYNLLFQKHIHCIHTHRSFVRSSGVLLCFPGINEWSRTATNWNKESQEEIRTQISQIYGRPTGSESAREGTAVPWRQVKGKKKWIYWNYINLCKGVCLSRFLTDHNY